MRWPASVVEAESRRLKALGGEACATLGTTVRQDGAACAGAHPQTEAVLLGAAAVIRLESPLAHWLLQKGWSGANLSTVLENRLTLILLVFWGFARAWGLSLGIPLAHTD